VSLLQPVEIRCARCEQRFEVEAAETLNVSQRPELREAVLAGTLHCFECPGCGSPLLLEKRVAYLDFARRHWLTVFPARSLRHRSALEAMARESFEEVMLRNCPPIVRSWAPDFERFQRVVFGMPALREKLLVFDAGIDDRLLEVLKLQMFRDLDLPFDPAASLRFERADEDELTFHFRAGAEPGPPAVVAISRVHLDRLAGQGGAPPAEVLPELAGRVVDYRIALVPDEPLPQEVAR
jgi:hypothetical protein